MNHFKTILLSLMLMFTSGVALDARVWPPSIEEIEAKVLDMNGLVERDGLVYKKDTTELFTGNVEGVPPYEWTGEVEGTYEKAHRYLKGSYQDGLKHGFWDWEYYSAESGSRAGLASRTTYMYGKEHGLYEFYNHPHRVPAQSSWDDYAFGAVTSRQMYKGGLIDGPWEEFEENGSLHSSGMAKDGHNIGLMNQYCYWNYQDHYLCKREFYNNEGEIEETKCYNVLGEIIRAYDGEGICDPSDSSSDSPSVEKADGTLLSRGVPCTTLDEVLIHYDAYDDWLGPNPTVMNLKSGASFYLILDQYGAYTKTFHILYRPVSVGLTDYCNFMQVGFQFPDQSYSGIPATTLSVGDTYPASFYYKKTYKIFGEQFDYEADEYVHEMYYDESTGELGYFMGGSSHAYDYSILNWNFDPVQAKFNLIEYKERNTGETATGTSGEPPNFVIDFSVTPPLWRHLLVTETQRLRYLMESAKRHRTADAKRRMDICSDPIKRADSEDYCTRASD